MIASLLIVAAVATLPWGLAAVICWLMGEPW
jgi:hypothetical protein